jgi:hypothetical protein
MRSPVIAGGKKNITKAQRAFCLTVSRIAEYKTSADWGEFVGLQTNTAGSFELPNGERGIF